MSEKSYKAWEKYNKACEKLVVAFLEKYYPEEHIDDVCFVGEYGNNTTIFDISDRYFSIALIAESLYYDYKFEEIKVYETYRSECLLNEACKQTIIEFLQKYYPDESIDTVYFVGDEKYTGVFMTDDERFYDIGFVAECFQYDATFEDIYTYQDYGLDCSLANRETRINFKNWVKHPEMRKTPEEQPFTEEEKLRQLLKKCIPALEGITQYESLLAEIKSN
jgi:hypothetical protein